MTEHIHLEVTYRDRQTGRLRVGKIVSAPYRQNGSNYFRVLPHTGPVRSVAVRVTDIRSRADLMKGLDQ